MKQLLNGFLGSMLLTIIWTACQSKSVQPDDSTSVTTDTHLDTMPRVTGIGGLFFYADDPAGLNQWYGENLGMKLDDYGAVFESRNANAPDSLNYLRWSSFPAQSDYFAPSSKPFMINYRVQYLERLVEQMKASGVTVLDTIAYYEYGKFVHIMDPEGNKIELWEPVDGVLTKLGSPTNK